MPYEIFCPYCNDRAELVDSAEIYGGKSYGMAYLCRLCDAYVGVHKHSPDHKPLGRLANKELRGWKKLAHGAFDPLWKRKLFRSRGEAYTWLSDALGIPKSECHIGMFDVEQCKQAFKSCLEYKINLRKTV